jgi:MscS family membrane protein
MAMWQYLGLLIMLVAGLLLYFILSKILNPILKRLTSYKRFPALVEKNLVRKMARLVSLLILLRFFRIMLPPLQLPIESSQFAIIVIKLLTILFVVMLIMNLLAVFITYGERYTQRTESKLDEQLVPIIKRTLQAVIIGVGIIQGLRVMQIDVTALIAGISIGGLALALAAQDMLKNLFGSLTIFLDRPFQIGDWINFSGVDGTVEEVGFRSTRVRTFANSMVYVPNGKLADMIINNYGLRNYRRFKTTIALTYDTPPLLIEKFVEGLRELVKNHPKTRKDYFEIHFNEMGSHSLDILFYAFFEAPSWTEELEGKQDILLSILRLGETLGVRFAFPTTTMHIEEFPGNGSTTPKYDTNPDSIDQKLEEFIKTLNEK